MATALINDSDTALRIGPNERRFPPHAVLELSGDELRDAKNYDAVREASDDEVETYAASLRGPGGGGTRGEELAAMSAAGRALSRGVVSADLNTVIGDDDAPHGPPTGTITTKQAAARVSERDRQAFSDNEWLPEEAEERDLSPVQQRQANTTEAIEELTAELVDVEPGASADTPEGLSGERASADDGDEADTASIPVDELKGAALDAEVERLELELPSKATADEKRAAVADAR